MKSVNAALMSASRVKRFCNNKWTHVIMRSIFPPSMRQLWKRLLGRELMAAQEEITYNQICLPRHICSNVFSMKYKILNGTMSCPHQQCSAHTVHSKTHGATQFRFRCLFQNKQWDDREPPRIKHIFHAPVFIFWPCRQGGQYDLLINRHCGPLLANTAISPYSYANSVACMNNAVASTRPANTSSARHTSSVTISIPSHTVCSFSSTGPRIDFFLQCSNTVTVPAKTLNWLLCIRWTLIMQLKALSTDQGVISNSLEGWYDLIMTYGGMLITISSSEGTVGGHVL